MSYVPGSNVAFLVAALNSHSVLTMFCLIWDANHFGSLQLSSHSDSGELGKKKKKKKEIDILKSINGIMPEWQR